MRFRGAGYRAHDPRWSFTPSSGDGAALCGGRFNQKGTPALYLSLSVITAIKEANQGFAHKIDPCLLCMYSLDCKDIADLRTDRGRYQHGVSLLDMSCAWFAMSIGKQEPPSWRIARRLAGEGYAGVLVPSFANAATQDDINLVLWNWSDRLPHKVRVSDPSGKLPKNQLSWK